jgi:uncharacterized protein involved in exopolysaccharide biosynthesis
MESNKQSQFDKGEFSPQELFEILWRGKWPILSVTIVCTLAAAVAARVLPKKYDASILVAPVSSPSGGAQFGGISSFASQLGGLASLAGLSAGGDSKKSESIAVLQSEALTEKYIQTNNLLPELYQSKWDPKKMQWTEKDPKKIPTLWMANQFFKKNVRAITTDAKTGLVTLTISWTSPATAAKWANGLVKMTNDSLRDKALIESERNIAYLNAEAAKTTLVQAQQAIFAILQTEIDKAMLARGSEEYAFKILDPATAPEKPSSPRLLTWLFVGMFGSLFLIVSGVLIRASWKSAQT